jgi:DNA-binding transcriptional MocR family regulator
MQSNNATQNSGGRSTMRAQSNTANSESDSVIPFAPALENAAADRTDQLDRAGQTILNMLHNAANLAEANSQHALDMAQKLSHQLRAAEAIRKEPNAPNNGCTESTVKSRIDS